VCHALGRQLTVTLPVPDGAGELTSPVLTTEYDAAGNVTKEIDALGNETDYAYDNLYRLTTLTQEDPDTQGGTNNPVTEFTYDAVGQLLTQINPGQSPISTN